MPEFNSYAEENEQLTMQSSLPVGEDDRIYCSADELEISNGVGALFDTNPGTALVIPNPAINNPDHNIESEIEPLPDNVYSDELTLADNLYSDQDLPNMVPVPIEPEDFPIPDHLHYSNSVSSDSNSLYADLPDIVPPPVILENNFVSEAAETDRVPLQVSIPLEEAGTDDNNSAEDSSETEKTLNKHGNFCKVTLSRH